MYLADADDGDADGTVDRFEFEQGMSQAQVHMGQYEIDALWDYFDPEGTGRIVHPHAMEVIRVSSYSVRPAAPELTENGCCRVGSAPVALRLCDLHLQS